MKKKKIKTDKNTNNTHQYWQKNNEKLKADESY